MKILRGFPFVLLPLMIFTGCAGPKKEAEKDKKDKEEYVYYTPTGSNLPIRVRKTQVKATDSETTQDQDLMRDLQQRGGRVPSDPESAGSKRN